jgi:DNA-binding NarL/FixJ family response regulator
MPDLVWRVVLVEDDADMLAYFAECTRAGPQLVLSGASGTLHTAPEWLTEHTADVLLTDLALPDGHGIELIHWLHARQPACDILVVSVFGDEETVLACIEAGAVGYLHKGSRPADGAQTILDVKRGASPISPMIARLHQVTLHTVQSHIRSLYGKLALHSRIEAAGLRMIWNVEPLPHWQAGEDQQAMRNLQFLLFEAFSTVLQHAQASELEVGARADVGGAIEVVLADNGRGMPLGTGAALRSIRVRADLLGAELGIEGPGRRLRVRLPSTVEAPRQ